MNLEQTITLSMQISSLREKLATKEAKLRDALHNQSTMRPETETVWATTQVTTQARKKGRLPSIVSKVSMDRSSPKVSRADQCLKFLENRIDWTHRSAISQFMDLSMARVSTVLTVLKKEGQVHNDGRGSWRYGRGDRKIDKIPRG